jgi:hypothetical protein
MSEPTTQHQPDVFKPDFPYYIYSGGGLKYFEIKLKPNFQQSFGLPEILIANVDPSHQYEADGKTWQQKDTRRQIPAHWVVGWREIGSTQ